MQQPHFNCPIPSCWIGTGSERSCSMAACPPNMRPSWPRWKIRCSGMMSRPGIIPTGRCWAGISTGASQAPNLDENSYLYVKGDFEPIIPGDLFRRCEEIRHSRTTTINGRRIGQNASQDVWLHKLLCSCSSRFRKNKWRTNKQGDSVYGYQCYSQSNNGSKTFREQNGLDTEGCCGIKMIADWKLELMAKEVFRQLWATKATVLETYKQFNIHLSAVQKAPNENIDLHSGRIDPSLIEKHVFCVVPVDNTHFCWYIDFTTGDKQASIGTDKNGEDAEHPHRTWDNASAFLPDGKNAYQFLIAACAGRYSDRLFGTTAPYPASRACPWPHQYRHKP